MRSRNSLAAVPDIKTILMSSICLCVLQLTPLPAFSQDKKDSTQKNTDGTTTTTEKFDWGSKATTLDSKGMLIDTVTTEGNDKFGKGGTKTKIESHKNGKHIDIVVYKDGSQKIRIAQKTEVLRAGNYQFVEGSAYKFLKGGTYTKTVQYDEAGRLKNYTFGDLKEVISGTEVGRDASGQPKVVGLKGEKLIDGHMEDIVPSLALEEGDRLLAEIREATERHMSIVEDISPIDPPDLEAPKPKEETSKKDTKSTTPTPKDAKPRLGAAPSSRTTPATKPRIATGVSGTVDSCLVGTWRSETITNDFVKQEGGAGILLTIKANGTVTIDYNGMTQLTGTDLGTNWWTGTATGHITTSNGTAKETSVENSELTHKYTDEQGKTSSNLLSGLGPATLSNRNYTCDETTLTYKAVQTFKFKREKKEPQ